VYFGDLLVVCSFPDRLNERTVLEARVVSKPEEKASLKLVTLNPSKLVFQVQQLSVLECLLVNLTAKPMLIKFEKLNSESSPVSIHKIIIEEEGGSGGFEVKEESSLPLKIIFFPRITGTFPFEFFKIHSIANKVATPVDYQSQDIVVN
jgi:hypothetical protein